MKLSILFYLGLLLLAGLFGGRMVKHVKLPNVTGYLLAGLLLGPYVFKVLKADMLPQLDLISEMALGFIAFTIGAEFKASYFKKMGAMPVVIAICEGLGAMLVVTLSLLAAGQPLSFALMLGAISTATAPAATIMVIKQYKARGPLTSTLLSVVALDDAVALISFGFAVAVSKNLEGAGGSVMKAILQPFGDVALALILGVVFGFAFMVPLRYFKKQSNRLCITTAFVFLAASISEALGASSLLTCMVMGATLINMSNSATEIMSIADMVTPPVYMLFFVISGAELNLSVLPSVGLAGIIYVIARVAGKWGGAMFGAAVMKAEKNIKKYLGPTLIPQAGVAIGLTLVAQSVVPEYAAAIRAIVLCGTLIYEIIGPMVSKVCLVKAGEIEQENL
ncbi:cation:proton antiporter [Acidaminobacterium chupaoyuni]